MKRNPVNRVDVSQYFDRLVDLSKTDPTAYESLRRQILTEYMQQVPFDKQEMLARLQWRVEQERQRAKNPYSAYLALSKMMWESLTLLRERQVELVNLWRNGATEKKSNDRGAQIIPFPGSGKNSKTN